MAAATLNFEKGKYDRGRLRATTARSAYI